MAETFYRHVITEQGLTLLAKLQLGVEAVITKVVAGGGYVDPIEMEKQTEITGPIGEMQLGHRELVDKKVVKLTARITNEGLEDTALITQVGVYARDPDEGEILYQLIQYNQPQTLPSEAANRGAIAFFECEIDLVFANAEGAAIPVTPGWFLNRGDMDRHDADPDAHQGVFSDLLGRMAELEERLLNALDGLTVRVKLLEDTLITDVQDNKKIIVFGDLSGILLHRGIYNAAQSRVEC